MDWKGNFPKENVYFGTDKGILYNAEAIETMSKFPERIFDAIITDPPYGTTACKWDTVIPFEDMWRELKKIRKDRTPIVLFGNEPFSSYLRVSNIREYRYDWYWEKEQGSNFVTVKYMPFKVIENIVVFSRKKAFYYPQMRKGRPYRDKKRPRNLQQNVGKMVKKPINNKGVRYPKNKLYFQNDTKKGYSYHPTQKPLALLEYLVKTYTNEDDLVLDFTCGSGTTLLACERLNRRWVGIEIEERYCEISKERILKELK